MPDKLNRKSDFIGAPLAEDAKNQLLTLLKIYLWLPMHVDIVFWPVAMDFKKSDVETMEDSQYSLL